MKQLIFAMLLIASCACQAQMGQPSNYYSLDRGHSEMDFSIKWMNRGKVKGTFDNISGAIYYDPKLPESLSGTLKINMKTLSTGIQLRDGVLMKEWFDTASYPYAYFQTLPLTKQDKPGKIKGNFTLKGITKTITLDFDKIEPPALDYQNDPFLIITGRTWISRKEFNVTVATSRYETSQNEMVAISDSVLIEFNLIAKQTSVANRLASVTFQGSRNSIVYNLVKDAAPADIPRKLDSLYKNNPAPNPGQDFSAWFVGVYFIATKDHSRALPLLQKSLEQFPTAINNFDALMQLYYEQKNIPEAKKWMNRILADDPLHPGALEYKKRI
jgi:polyisoprenoid-binding protein YceI